MPPGDLPTEKQTVENNQNFKESMDQQIKEIQSAVKGLRTQPPPTLEDGIELGIKLIVAVALLFKTLQSEIKQRINGRGGSPEVLPAASSDMPADAEAEHKKLEGQLKGQQKTEADLTKSLGTAEQQLKDLPSTVANDAPERTKIQGQIDGLRKQLEAARLAVLQLQPRVKALAVEQGLRVADVKALNERLQKNTTSPAQQVAFAEGKLTITFRSTITDAQRKSFEAFQKSHPAFFTTTPSGNPVILSMPGGFWARSGPGAEARAAFFDFLAGGPAPASPESQAKDKGDKAAEDKKKTAADQAAKTGTEAGQKTNNQPAPNSPSPESQAKDKGDKAGADQAAKKGNEAGQKTNEAGVKTSQQPIAKLDQSTVKAANQPIAKLDQSTVKQAEQPIAKTNTEGEIKLQGNPQEVKQTLDKFNQNFTKLNETVTKTREQFEENATPATYASFHAALAAIMTYLAIGSISTVILPLVRADVEERMKDYQEMEKSLEKMWTEMAEARKRRDDYTRKMFADLGSAVGANDLSRGQTIVAELRKTTENWAKEDGASPDRFRDVIAAAEGLLSNISTNAELRTQAELYRQDSIKILGDRIAGAEKMIKGRQADIDNISLGWSPGSWLTGPISRISGTTGGMEKSLQADRKHMNLMIQARADLYRMGSSLGNETAQARIDRIQRLMISTCHIDYTEANRQLARAQSILKTTENGIRAVAEYLPGGTLGIALADYRINPNNPDNARNITRALASTAIDLIPIPGASSAGRIARRGALRAVGNRTVARGAQMLGEHAYKHTVEKVIREAMTKDAHDIINRTI